jgi:deazaflavin-dependent oxidoreductase (nitroreductase family)
MVAKSMKGLGAFLVVLLVGAALLVLGLRARVRPVQRAQRRLNRSLLNPWQLKTAGQPGAFASVIQHRGRRSGQTYRTPVVAVPGDGVFVIALPYGASTDWCQNVLASGQATLTTDGCPYEVDRPEILPIDEVEPYFPARLQRSHRLAGVHECLRVRPVQGEVRGAGASPTANETAPATNGAG